MLHITLTVDNASANFTAIAFLAKHLPDVYENGKHLHVKCMTHILNLIVKDGFKYQNYHIDCIQRAVKYVRQTPQRIAKFKKVMKEVGLEKKPFLCGESPTRWNSTFEVLQKTLSLQEAFVKYAIQDKELEREVERVPNNSDFKAISNMIKFLEKFKIKTEIVSTSTRPVVNQFLGEVLDVDIHLRKWGLVTDFMHMVIQMRDKYDKYWGDYDKFNDYTLFAVLLDPTLKSQLLLHSFKTRITQLDPENEKTNSTKDLEAYALLRGVESRLEKLYKYYVERYDTGESSKKHSQNEELFHVDENDFLGSFLNAGSSGMKELENELKMYLNEKRLGFKKDFDILGWWKVNSPRFPIVFRMARDILPLQISTVASESAFSTCGRVLTEYRSNLTTGLVEALITTADWMKKNKSPITGSFEDIMNDADVALELAEALENLDQEKAFEEELLGDKKFCL